MINIEKRETVEEIEQPRDFSQFKYQIEELGSGKYQFNKSSLKALEDFWINRDEFIKKIKDKQLHILIEPLLFDEHYRTISFSHNIIKGSGILVILIGVIVFLASLLIKFSIAIGPIIVILGIAINRFGQYKKSKFFVNISQSLQENVEDDFSLICFYYLVGVLGFGSSFGTTLGEMYPSHALNGKSD